MSAKPKSTPDPKYWPDGDDITIACPYCGHANQGQGSIEFAKKTLSPGFLIQCENPQCLDLFAVEAHSGGVKALKVETLVIESDEDAN
jgi:hypothetical protein